MAEHGHFYWNELLTRDVEGAKAFYGKLAGWQFEGMAMPDGGTYWVAKDGEQPVGGIMDISAERFEGVPSNWFAYLAIDDVDARVEQGKAAGAELVRPIFDIPGVGRIAIIKDPTGAGSAGSPRRPGRQAGQPPDRRAGSGAAPSAPVTKPWQAPKAAFSTCAPPKVCCSPPWPSLPGVPTAGGPDAGVSLSRSLAIASRPTSLAKIAVSSRPRATGSICPASLAWTRPV